MSKYVKFVVPLIIFGVILLLLANALMQEKDNTLKSTLIDKPAPEFTLPLLDPASAAIGEQMRSTSLQGRIWLLHVFASWCVSCASEHAVVTQLADTIKAQNIALIGLNYKDEIDDASNWLKRFGNPYTHIVSDYKGYTAIDYGVTGTPETFIIDKNGIVRLKFVGPMEKNDVEQVILPLLNQLQNAG